MGEEEGAGAIVDALSHLLLAALPAPRPVRLPDRLPSIPPEARATIFRRARNAVVVAGGMLLAALGMWGAAVLGVVAAIAGGVWYLWAAPVVAPPPEPAPIEAPAELAPPAEASAEAASAGGDAP